jgi:hypothetical protein
LLARGVLQLNSQVMSRLAESRWDYHLEYLENLATQRADFICGVILLVTAFGFHLVKEVAPIRTPGVFYTNRLLSSSRFHICTACAVIAVAVIASYLLAPRFRLESARTLAARRLSDFLSDGKITQVEFDKALSLDAQNLVDLAPGQSEPKLLFVERYAAALGIAIPEDIDLSELSGLCDKLQGLRTSWPQSPNSALIWPRW